MATDDPPGHNGFVKIEHPVGGSAGTPDNNPHQACRFSVEWYNFDRGDLLSRVELTSIAPTRDAVLTIDGPTAVQVGEDAARGGSKDPDAVETYRLVDAVGAAARQGFHVKLVVRTPGPHGVERKSKVFWLAPCAASGTPDRSHDRDVDLDSVDSAGPVLRGVPTVVVAPPHRVASGTPDLSRLLRVDAGIAPTEVTHASARWSPWPVLGLVGLLLLGLGAALVARLLGAGSKGRHRA